MEAAKASVREIPMSTRFMPNIGISPSIQDVPHQLTETQLKKRTQVASAYPAYVFDPAQECDYAPSKPMEAGLFVLLPRDSPTTVSMFSGTPRDYNYHGTYKFRQLPDLLSEPDIKALPQKVKPFLPL